MTTTVYLHIGPPKTGTGYIQSALGGWYKELRNEGILFPGGHEREHFLAAVDARGDRGFKLQPGDDTERAGAVGGWARLLAKTTAHDGTVIISHEVFATCDDEHAAAVVSDLAGTDLHLVVTARDPARQIVSAWQQRVRQGSTQPLDGVLRGVQKRKTLSPAQDLDGLTERWARTLQPDHVHVVTVPAAGGAPTLLWDRFAEAVGIDPVRFDASRANKTNRGTGWVEVELLRRVNEALDGRLPAQQYNRVMTRFYASRALAELPPSRKVSLPVALQQATDEIADRWITALRDRRYQVVGDLEDLRAQPAAEDDGKAPSEAEIAQLAAAATAELLLQLAELDDLPTARDARRYEGKKAERSLVERVRRRLT